ncbi:hypothetical protein C1645_836675 [Glomus cerebriforme]|uniref:Uncharacterized protein n=1 Tax=Glomus cerebriforme TaxID=658196 RepID=A0A397SC95_9GLOM|nr:hypothetical protein C1645_836675 [Glomus cerebriforme]
MSDNEEGSLKDSPVQILHSDAEVTENIVVVTEVEDIVTDKGSINNDEIIDEVIDPTSNNVNNVQNKVLNAENNLSVELSDNDEQNNISNLNGQQKITADKSVTLKQEKFSNIDFDSNVPPSAYNADQDEQFGKDFINVTYEKTSYQKVIIYQENSSKDDGEVGEVGQVDEKVNLSVLNDQKVINDQKNSDQEVENNQIVDQKNNTTFDSSALIENNMPENMQSKETDKPNNPTNRKQSEIVEEQTDLSELFDNSIQLRDNNNLLREHKDEKYSFGMKKVSTEFVDKRESLSEHQHTETTPFDDELHTSELSNAEHLTNVDDKEQKSFTSLSSSSGNFHSFERKYDR